MNEREADFFKHKLMRRLTKQSERRLAESMDFCGKTPQAAMLDFKQAHANLLLQLDYNNNEIRNLAPSENSLKYDLIKGRDGQELAGVDLCDTKPLQELDILLTEALNRKKNVPDRDINILGVHATNTTNKLLADFCNPESYKNLVSTVSSYENVRFPRHTILLDSRNRNLSHDRYSWDLIPFQNMTTQLGQINSRDNIHQVIEVRIGNFRLPISSGDFTAPYYKKIRVGIEELNAQGTEFASANDFNRKYYYHFECRATPDGNFLNIDGALWRPNKLITKIDRISLNFFGLNEPIPLDADRATCTLLGNPAVCTVPFAHNLQTGDLIYLGNTDTGYFISVLSATTFEIDYDASVAETQVVYFASKRIQIEMKFITLEN